MAGALVGGAVLSAFLQVAFDRLASPAVLDYFRAKKLDQKLLDKLKVSLLFINAVMDDAEEKHIRDKNVKSWLDLVKDAVLDADDLLDEIHTKSMKRKLEAESQPNTNKVWSYFPTSFSSFDRKVKSRIKEILDKLELLASKKDILKLKERSGVSVGLGNSVYQRLPATSLVDEAAVCGRDDDKSIIVDLLLSDNLSGNNPCVICIVGMGGMGKTTLAQLAYNDHRMKGEFELTAWVCVSEEFDVLRVTRTVLEAIDVPADDMKDLNNLQVKLKEKLTGKKFLLVLDDIWNEVYSRWEALLAPFIHGAHGSKLLVTTRSEKVASTMRCTHLHGLKQLPEEESWLLFSKHALRDTDPRSNTGFEAIGRRIVTKCKGLPLALKSIGSLLYSESSYEEWNRVLCSEIWDMSDDKGEIIPALILSYHYLPSHLKRCFAYCSIFPKDYEFDKELLVQLWMAEGFLQPHQQNKSMKELGDQWLNDLLSRSFFQRVNGARMLFVMHDLINDLAKYVSGEFCLRFENDDEAKNVSKMTRHFSYLGYSPEFPKQFEVFHNCNKLRTFLPLHMYEWESFVYAFTSTQMIHGILSNFKCLRVLRLSRYSNVNELPDSVVNLIHLRYLDLSRTDVKRLPDSICLLFNLQTLKLTNCRSFKELPSDMNKLINLCYLDFRGTKVRKVPTGLGKLKNLEVLSSYYVGKGGESNINELAELNLRGTLDIEDLQNVAHPIHAFAANLKNKIYLEELSLKWSTNDDGSQSEREVLEKLQPPENLKKLTIRNYGGTRFPDWFGDNSLSNVVSLTLVECKYCTLLPPLGILPSLKKLSIEGLNEIVVIGSDFFGNNSSTCPFGSLQVLNIESMAELEKWDCENAAGAFPCLEELRIKYCPKLKNQLPQQLVSLQMLHINNCKQLVASLPLAPAIKELSLHSCGSLEWESHPSSLKTLHISGSDMEASMLERVRQLLVNTHLTSFQVAHCPDMEFPISHSHAFLESFKTYRSCDSLKTFPLDLFPTLVSLQLIGCRNLERLSIPEGHHLTLTSLTSLQIDDCPRLMSFPKGFSAPKLQLCYIMSVKSLKSLPEDMHTLIPSLQRMYLEICPELESFPEGGLPPKLEALDIHYCPKLTASPMRWSLHGHISLVEFSISEANVESFPYEGLLPPTLKHLSLENCPNLQTLDYKGLCHLTSLEWLKIVNCPRLQCLPKEGLPKSLYTLYIRGNCPMLKRRCQKNGEDWSMIAHISKVIIDSVIIV